jgi:hypothetical protein
MLGTLIKAAFAKSRTYFFGSIAATLVTFFGLKNYFEWTYIYSIAGGIGIFLSVNLLLLLPIAISMLSAKQNEIDALNGQLAGQRKANSLKADRKTQSVLTAKNYFGDVLIDMKQIFSGIYLLRRKPQFSEQEVIDMLRVICNVVKQRLETRGKGYVYSVSIKVLANRFDKLSTNARLETLIRDDASNNRRKKHESVEHHIRTNTCFLEIFNNLKGKKDKLYYLNQDLVSDITYRNSSHEAYAGWSDKFNKTQRKKEWPLPYRSELVLAIYPGVRSSSEENLPMLGYLCIDCSLENKFHPEYDVECFQGLAEGIYPIMETLFPPSSKPSPTQSIHQ